MTVTNTIHKEYELLTYLEEIFDFQADLDIMVLVLCSDSV